MKFLKIVSSIILGAGSSVALANGSDMIYLIDAYCVRTEVKIDVVEKMLIGLGGRNISSKFSQMSPAMIGHGGIAYMVKWRGSEYLIALTKAGGCTVMGSGFEAKEVQESLERNYPLAKPINNDSGVQLERMWFIDKPSIYSGGIFSLTRSKSEFDKDKSSAITISYLPESVVNRVKSQKK